MLFRFFSTCSSLLLSWSLRHDFAFRAVSAPGVAACECVILAPRAPNSHLLCSVRPRFHQGLGCPPHALSRAASLQSSLDHRIHGMVVDSVVPRVVHFLCVAKNASSLEPLPRRSVSQSAICTFHQALLCSVFPRSYTRLLLFVVFCFGPRAAIPPKLSLCDSPQLSPLRLALCLLVSGHFSTQTRLH